MSAVALQLLVAFSAFPKADRKFVVAELLTRHPVRAGDLPNAALAELADELLRRYDAEETARTTPPG